jgi:hypothetical protein
MDRYVVWGLVAGLGGLTITAIGAYIAARAVIISPESATMLAGTYWDENPHLKQAILDQSSAAFRGLILVMGGSVLQGIAAVIQAWPSLVAVMR